MRLIDCLKLAGGSLLLAAFVYGILAALGLLTDTGSTVSLNENIVTVHR